MRLTLATSVVATLALAPSASAGSQAPTSVRIDGWHGHVGATPTAIDIVGHVVSDARGCLRFRAVTFYEPVAGPDRKLGRDIGNSNASFSLMTPSDTGGGEMTVYAVVERRKLRNGTICKAGRSPDEFLACLPRASGPRRICRSEAAGPTPRRASTTLLFDYLQPRTFGKTRARARGEIVGYDAAGRVISGKRKCRRFRKVVVYRVADGRDPKVGTDYSDSHGGWSHLLTNAQQPESSAFFAIAPRRKLRSGKTCRRARSSVLGLA